MKIKQDAIINLRLFTCSVYSLLKDEQQSIFYYADVEIKGKRMHIGLVPKSNSIPKKDISQKVKEIVSKNKTPLKFLKESFDVVSIIGADDSIVTKSINPINPNTQIRIKFRSLVTELIPCAKLFRVYNEAFVQLFGYDELKANNNCYVLLKSGEIGFKYGNSVFKLSSSPKKESVLNIRVNNNFSLTLTTRIEIDSVKIIKSGKRNDILGKEIYNRLFMYKKALGPRIDYQEYFKFLYSNKDNVRVAQYYNMLFNAKESEYEKVFDFVVNKTIIAFMQPHLLSVSPKEAKNNSIEEKKIDSSNYYSFLNYKETKGIFYTLSNENSVLSDTIDKSFNIKNIKQFAYVSGQNLSKYFSFLSVTIIPKDSVIQFKYHNGKWNEIFMPINIEEFIVSYKTTPSGIALFLWNITSTVAKKTFASERHTTNSRYLSNSPSKKEFSYKKTSTIVELPQSHATSQQRNDSETVYINNDDLDRKLAEKKMHYRRGHWHYYWYGAHNSSERHKELKWVEETIVNREAINVVIIV